MTSQPFSFAGWGLDAYSEVDRPVTEFALLRLQVVRDEGKSAGERERVGIGEV
jgi:hypothetical protein